MTSVNQEIMNPRLVPPALPGFPFAPDDWSPAVAEALADEEGVDLAPEHWEILGAIQEYFARNARAQTRELHDALHEKFHVRGGMKYLYGRFPGGPVPQGCRIAGLSAATLAVR